MEENQKSNKPEKMDVECECKIGVKVRYVNEIGRTRMVSVIMRIVLAIISGSVAVMQSQLHGLFSAICMYWVVLFLLNMYELALVNKDIERSKRILNALEKEEVDGPKE